MGSSGTSIVWPPLLPQAPRLTETEANPGDETLRTSMDAGPAKLRRRFSASPESLPMGLIVTGLQTDDLLDFYRTACSGGSLAFQWRHPRTGQLVDMRWKSVPKFKPLAPRASDRSEAWLATFELETVPGTAIDGDPNPPPPGGSHWFPEHQFNDGYGMQPGAPEDGEEQSEFTEGEHPAAAPGADPFFGIDHYDGAAKGTVIVNP